MKTIWQRASESLSRFCEGKARVSIPARTDDDDITIADALNLGAALAPRLAACESEREARTKATSRVIVCLCGSTRFWRTFQHASLAETMAGRIVLSIGAASGTDDEHFGNLSRPEYDRLKADLDALHLDKIELADEVLILNVGDYIGESTTRELLHARALGKAVCWYEWPTEHALHGEARWRLSAALAALPPTVAKEAE